VKRFGSASDSRRIEYQIFSEGRITGLKLKNRLVRAATAEGAIINGEMSDEWIDPYRALADGGVSLIAATSIRCTD
jgi:2,4-dienoyl-CoA reductase-like NADH-dependent reductase (Old Yellow Enzyme family)